MPKPLFKGHTKNAKRKRTNNKTKTCEKQNSTNGTFHVTLITNWVIKHNGERAGLQLRQTKHIRGTHIFHSGKSCHGGDR